MKIEDDLEAFGIAAMSLDGEYRSAEAILKDLEALSLSSTFFDFDLLIMYHHLVDFFREAVKQEKTGSVSPC
ncbi:hypothetical protein PQ478_09240 [Alkalihalophilus pseudofirmus]|uniref:hypothetical protein n=1 Tax=Alkalihalophilus pseudofirmus TaxID=79885 RepID=UPI00259BA896|nr:hypothetical protein [Alkalihalophilus pseudofirmus]WEG18653.1 hypothetical protein PQ478_09240 [Alkalihalophilus pseudofirmus]